MAHTFGELLGSRLPRPVKVWVLDTLPGEVRAGEAGRRDHPQVPPIPPINIFTYIGQ